MTSPWGVVVVTFVGRLVFGIVTEGRKPFRGDLFVDLHVAGSCVLVLNHELNVFIFEVIFKRVEHGSLRAVELGPYFDSENILTTNATLIEKTNA